MPLALGRLGEFVRAHYDRGFAASGALQLLKRPVGLLKTASIISSRASQATSAPKLGLRLERPLPHLDRSLDSLERACRAGCIDERGREGENKSESEGYRFKTLSRVCRESLLPGQQQVASKLAQRQKLECTWPFSQ